MAKSSPCVHHRPVSSPASPSVGARKAVYHYCLRTFLTYACSLLVVFPGLASCTFYTHGNKSLAEAVEASNKMEDLSRVNDIDFKIFSSEQGFDKLKSTRLDLQYWAILDPRHLIQYEKKLVRSFDPVNPKPKDIELYSTFIRLVFFFLLFFAPYRRSLPESSAWRWRVLIQMRAM
jgi:hypothetical protein